MNAYIYNAALYCEPCGTRKQESIKSSAFGSCGMCDFFHTKAAHREEYGDSNEWPQGPYSDGGGESDTPAHCEVCGVVLENPLTTDGVEYVRELIAEAKADALDGRNGVDNENALQYLTTFYADVLA